MDEPPMSSANQSAGSTLIGNLTEGESKGVDQSSLSSSSVFARRGSLPNGLQIGTGDKAGTVTIGESQQVKDDNAGSLVEERKPQHAAKSPQSSSESLEPCEEKGSSPNDSSPKDSSHHADSSSSSDSSHHADSPILTQKSNPPTERSESLHHTEQKISADLHHSRHSLPDVISRRTAGTSVDGPDTSSSLSMEKEQKVRTQC